MNNKAIHVASFALVIAGGLNWGLIGLFNLDLIDLILGSIPFAARTVYVLVGLAAVVLLATHKKDCKTCSVADHISTGPTPPDA